MTPDRRLDQLEPLMADSLQKIDRLIEGQGRIIDLITKIDQKADVANQKADITAKAIANITFGLQRVESDINQLRAGQDRIEANQSEILTILKQYLK